MDGVWYLKILCASFFLNISGIQCITTVQNTSVHFEYIALNTAALHALNTERCIEYMCTALPEYKHIQARCKYCRADSFSQNIASLKIKKTCYENLIVKNVSIRMVGEGIQKALMYSDTCCDTHVFALVQNFESRDFHE